MHDGGEQEHFSFPTDAEAPAEEFTSLVRQALAKLYDFRYLQSHALTQQLLGSARVQESGPASTTLRRHLLDALELLNPGRDIYFRSQQARTYSLLHMHYVEGSPLQEVAADLGISLRQAQRDLKRGVEIIAAHLWSRRSLQAQPGPRAAELSSLDTEVQRLNAQAAALDFERLVRRGSESVARLAAQRSITFALRPLATNPVVTANPTAAQQVITNIFSSIAQQVANCAISVEVAHRGVQLELTWICAGVGTAFAPAPLPELASRLAEREGWRLAQFVSPAGAFVVKLGIAGYRSTLLVIDDNEGLVQLLMRYLAGYSVLVLPAHTGSEGLQIAREVPLNGILVDVMMPGMDGWEVVQRLRARPETTTIPIIVCTVFNDPQLAASLGATALLPKPVRRDDVLTALMTHGILTAANHP